MTLFRCTLIAAACMPFLLGWGATARAADPVHVRGTITAVEGSKLTLKTREGKDLALTVGPDWKIGGVAKASLDDIKPGTFIGTANVVGPSGAKALEVVVFPEALRGTGEGDYGWDLQPNSQMTNATVSNPVQGVDGRTVTLTYKGGVKKVTIPPNAPIVDVVAATADDLKPGAAVFIFGAAAEATLNPPGQIVVGKDGIVPPM